MDRLNQLRGEVGGSRDSTLDTSSPPCDSFLTANESSSKYFSLSEVDSTFDIDKDDISSIKDVSLTSTTTEAEKTITNPEELISNLSPIGKKSDILDNYKIDTQIEAANILSGGVAIFDDNSYDGNELVIDDNAEIDEKSNPESSQSKTDGNIEEPTIEAEPVITSKDTTVSLQINGKNVDLINVGHRLYLYRMEDNKFAAIQIINDEQEQPTIKFLKVRNLGENDLEVYEEIVRTVQENVPAKKSKMAGKTTLPHVPIIDINKVISESTNNKIADQQIKGPQQEPIINIIVESENEEVSQESKTEVNFNGKPVKLSESRKSPIIGSFTTMTYHSTPIKEGISLMKTMVDQQLHTYSQSQLSIVKKTIEDYTDHCKKTTETPTKSKNIDIMKIEESVVTEKGILETDKKKIEHAEETEVIDNITTKESMLVNKSMNIENVERNSTIKDSVPINVTDPGLIKRDNDIIPNTAAGEHHDTIKAIQINDDVTITELETYEKNTQAVLEDKSKIELEGPMKCDVENAEIDINETILIDDDDISVVEVVVDSKSENENELCNIKDVAVIGENIVDNLNHSNSIAIIDENNSKLEKMTKNNSDTGILHKNIGPRSYDIELETNSNTVPLSAHEVPTEIKNNSNEDLLSSQNKMNDSISPKTKDIANIVQQKNDTLTTSINVPKLVSLEFGKPIKISEEKYATQKEDITKNDSPDVVPLLEHKQKSLVSVKSGLPNKIEVKNDSLNISNTSKEKMVANENECKSFVKVSFEDTPIKAIPIAQSAAVVSDMQIYSDKTPNLIDQVSNKTDAENTTNSGLEVQVPISVDKTGPVLDKKLSFRCQKDEKKDDVMPQKSNVPVKATNVMNIEIKKVPKLDASKTNTTSKQSDIGTSSNINNQGLKYKIEPKYKKEAAKMTDKKPVNNDNVAVPFGKWTDANRQEFLNKFKIKSSVVPSNSNQLKNSNDLNRRDVLKKIDSQRQTSTALSKSQEAGKHMMKPETAAFTNKPNIIIKESIVVKKAPQKSDKNEIVAGDVVPVTTTTKTTINIVSKSQNKPKSSVINLSKKEVCQTKGNVQNLIDKTIEGMIHRDVPASKPQSEPKNNQTKDPIASKATESHKALQPLCDAKLDEIEMKMNELHGIPFIERPPHELPQVYKTEPKKHSHVVEKEMPTLQDKTKIPNLLPFPNKNQQKVSKEIVADVDSEEELIEHEPITGDIDLTKKNLILKPTEEKLTIQHEEATSKKDAIITEKDFDKFARRNSITYENCLTVNFDAKKTHNVVQTVIEKEPIPKNSGRNDIRSLDSKTKQPLVHQNVLPNLQSEKEKFISKPPTDDSSNKTQSKVQKAYYSALSEKKLNSNPVNIVDDKPVKVVFMDKDEATSTPTQLNVQGPDLSPNKNPVPDSDVAIKTTDESFCPDRPLPELIGDPKSHEDGRTKTKHQRKQVLTPVEEPELELIEPRDLGIEVSPKKKRKTDDDKIDRNLKHPMRKNYLLGSSTQDNLTNQIDVTKSLQNDTIIIKDSVVAKSTVSALDSLVKAAELIETQTEKMKTSIVPNPLKSDSQSNTPAKRGRGRPRKYPLTPDGTVDKSKVTPSPQKKPRLIDDIAPKRHVFSDDSDSDEELIKENWTMGKINENIVCPICNKLFRTENVVFKHVKHCTGSSPSRSDSDKTSPNERRRSRDSDSKSPASKSDDMDIDDDKPLITQKLSPKKRKSKDSMPNLVEKDEVIVIEDTPIKEKPETIEVRKHHVSRQSKTKIPLQSSNLVCEFCGKTFRQLSYLVSHKLQHKKQDKVEPKKTEKEVPLASKSVFSCEVCKKEFRKLHHLVQHRFIHNSISTPARSRKSSFEQSESKAVKEPNISKQSEDPSAGFRCEPCDKSFRKLHHLVEHRETHDGINRQKSNSAPVYKEDKNVEKPILHQCDICKKSFKKLILLKEHKDQHIETSSEKSDDKSVKSALSTKDIIHECSLCYMVFPNEHSLNKHGVFCQRKKRQSKQVKPVDEADDVEEVTESPVPEDIHNIIELDESSKVDVKEIVQNEEKQESIGKVENVTDKPAKDILNTLKENSIDTVEIIEEEKSPQAAESEHPEPQVCSLKRVALEPPKEATREVPQKVKKNEDKEPAKVIETPKKKAVLKDKIANTDKRPKSLPVTSVAQEVKPVVDSSDDDEVRYMLNPNFKVEDVTEEKVFMKVRAKKRSSLQIERPDSKDLMKRRTSLQYPPKIPRLKPKPVEVNTTVKKEVIKPKLEPVPSTDSDDSDTTKYSFPSTVIDKPAVLAQNKTPKESERKTPKKALADKRKSLSGIAKRKSLGKAVTTKHKLPALKQVKKRTLEAEHRCDCGQLFSSAALLSRHTTLAHTPPRIRRRRSPSPDVKPAVSAKPAAKSVPRKSVAAEKPEPTTASRKSSSTTVTGAATTKPTKSDVKPTKKSLEKAAKLPSEVRKSKPPKIEESSVKPRRTGAHRGVPIPEKMRKLLEKIK